MSFLLHVCFDQRNTGFVLSNETLRALASNCPRLPLLCLADISTLSDARADPDENVYAPGEAFISHTTTSDPFARLPMLENWFLVFAKTLEIPGQRWRGLVPSAHGLNF